MTDKTVEIIQLELNKLHLEENDYLVFKFKDDVSASDIYSVQDALSKALPKLSNKIILLQKDIEIYVVHKEDKNDG